MDTTTLMKEGPCAEVPDPHAVPYPEGPVWDRLGHELVYGREPEEVAKEYGEDAREVERLSQLFWDGFDRSVWLAEAEEYDLLDERLVMLTNGELHARLEDEHRQRNPGECEVRSQRRPNDGQRPTPGEGERFASGRPPSFRAGTERKGGHAMAAKTDGPEPRVEGRVVHVMRDPCDLYVGRENARVGLPGSGWANPFRIGRDGDRRTVLARFEQELRRGSLSHLLPRLRELEGLTLACWCAPKGGVGPRDPLVCHAQILLKVLAELAARRPACRVVRETNPTFDTSVVERRVLAGGLSRTVADRRVRELDEEARSSGALAVHSVETEFAASGMKEAAGDLWETPADLRVITTNGDVNRDGAAVMGRGCAREVRQRITGLEYHFASLLRCHGNRVMRLTKPRKGAALASFPVKRHWHEAADLELIRRSARQLVALADKFGCERVVLPRPGCGNGRLRWEEVMPILADILDDRFTVVHKRRIGRGRAVPSERTRRERRRP